jgi:hypothetical protein
MPQEGAYFNNAMFLRHYLTLKPQVTTKHLINYDETQYCCQVYFATPLDKMYELQIQPKVDVNMFIMAQ